MFCLSSLHSMNPGVQVGLSTSAASPLATQTKHLQPTPTSPCLSSPSLQTTRTTPTHTCSIISTHTPLTYTPLMTPGPVMGQVPARSRTFHVTEPAPSLSTGTLWVGIPKHSLHRLKSLNSLFCCLTILRLQLPRAFVRQRSR